MIYNNKQVTEYHTHKHACPITRKDIAVYLKFWGRNDATNRMGWQRHLGHLCYQPSSSSWFLWWNPFSVYSQHKITPKSEKGNKTHQSPPRFQLHQTRIKVFVCVQISQYLL